MVRYVPQVAGYVARSNPSKWSPEVTSTLWLLGLGTSYTLGGLIHILLVVAIVVVLLRVIQGRNPIRG